MWRNVGEPLENGEGKIRRQHLERETLADESRELGVMLERVHAGNDPAGAVTEQVENSSIHPLRRTMFDASWAAMFVIELIYKAELATIDAHMTAHVKFLKKYYASGNFLISGRKTPRDGGIILAVGKSRAEIEAIVHEDPFFEHDLADFRIIEFRASQRADDIQERIDRF